MILITHKLNFVYIYFLLLKMKQQQQTVISQQHFKASFPVFDNDIINIMRIIRTNEIITIIEIAQEGRPSSGKGSMATSKVSKSALGAICKAKYLILSSVFQHRLQLLDYLLKF